MHERQLPTYPTWERYMVLSKAIAELPVRDRRHLFQLVRQSDLEPSADLFFPPFGFTLGEFAVWHLLGDR